MTTASIGVGGFNGNCLFIELIAKFICICLSKQLCEQQQRDALSTWLLVCAKDLNSCIKAIRDPAKCNQFDTLYVYLDVLTTF